MKPEIVSDTYCSSKMPETIEVDVRMEKLRKLRFQMCSDDIEWKEVDHLLVEKSAAASIVRDFTVHHQRSPLVMSRPKELSNIGGESGETILDPDDPPWTSNQNSDDPLSPPFELQTLDDSPRSSQLHIKDVQEMGPDGQESQTEFFELGVMQETPPDILEPTKQTYISINTTGQQILSNPVLTTFGGGSELGEQCVITTKKPSSTDPCALVNEGLRTNTYSTFRPPSNPSQCTFQSQFIEIRSKEDENHDTISFLQKSDQKDVQNSSQPKSLSPSLKSKCEKPIVLKNPDIGDESLTMVDSTLKKKDVLGLQVAAPVVPTMEKDASGNVMDPQQSKKGWSITTV